MEVYALLIGGGIAVVAVIIASIWLNKKLKPKSPAKGKAAAKGIAAAKGKKKAKGKKDDKFFRDKGQVLDEDGNVLEDSNLYKMKEDREKVYKDGEVHEDDGKTESWDKYG